MCYLFPAFFRTSLCLLICIFPFYSCSKLIQVPPPENQISAADVFSTDRNATSAIIGIYTEIMDNSRSLLNGGMSLYGGLSSDELRRTTTFDNEDAFTRNALSSQNPLCSSLYTTSYPWIYDCNTILEKVPSSTGISTAVKESLQGEARFIRALIFFYLVNLYGDIPLVTTTDYNANSQLPRAPSSLIYQQIIADLKEAQSLLPEDYITTSAFPNARIRPNKYAATALLARVYLYQRDWVHAAQEASTVINNNVYQLETDLNKVFLSESREAIWELQPVHDNIGTAEGSFFVPSDTVNPRPAYTLANPLLGSFEAGDLRLRYWTGSSRTDSSQYTYPFKYKLPTDTPLNRECNIVLRLAEQYLIRSEATAQQGNIAAAAADLDRLRHRAGLSQTLSANQADLLDAVRHERQIEFFAEWGHRWLDLKRTRQIDSILAADKLGWTSQAALYPIPFTELLHNDKLIQNPGY